MTIRETILRERALDASADASAELDVALQMGEDAFRGFYDRTSRMLWAYLARLTGDRQAADDLLQECYYRLPRSNVALDSESHRRHYLFRIRPGDGRARPDDDRSQRRLVSRAGARACPADRELAQCQPSGGVDVELAGLGHLGHRRHRSSGRQPRVGVG